MGEFSGRPSDKAVDLSKVVPKKEKIDEKWKGMPEGGRLKAKEFSVKLSKKIEKEIKDFLKKEDIPDRVQNVIQHDIKFWFDKPGFRITAIKKEKDMIDKGM